MMSPPSNIFDFLIYFMTFILFLKLSEAIPLDEKTADAVPISVEKEFNKRETLRRVFDDCESEFSWMCVKVEFIKLMERLAEQKELSLMPGISVVKDVNATEMKSPEMMAEVARNYPNDPSARLNGFIITKLSDFLRTHYLRFKLIDATTIAEARSFAVGTTGRKGKFGKKGGLEALIAAGVMMKGMLMAIGMGAIALTAGKALMTALMALTLSGVLGLKSLASGGGKSTTYEIVAKPVYTSSHSHSVSGTEGGHYGGGGGGGGISYGHGSGSGGWSGNGYKRAL